LTQVSCVRISPANHTPHGRRYGRRHGARCGHTCRQALGARCRPSDKCGLVRRGRLWPRQAAAASPHQIPPSHLNVCLFPRATKKFRIFLAGAIEHGDAGGTPTRFFYSSDAATVWATAHRCGDHRL
jgi:hypothetical protein